MEVKNILEVYPIEACLMGKGIVEVSGCQHTALAVYSAVLQWKVYFVAASAASQTPLIHYIYIYISPRI